MRPLPEPRQPVSRTRTTLVDPDIRRIRHLWTPQPHLASARRGTPTLGLALPHIRQYQPSRATAAIHTRLRLPPAEVHRSMGHPSIESGLCLAWASGRHADAHLAC